MLFTDPYVSANGTTFADEDAATQAHYLSLAHGDVAQAAALWARDFNQGLLSQGQAVVLPNGATLTVSQMLNALLMHGYTGATDPQSVTEAYAATFGTGTLTPGLPAPGAAPVQGSASAPLVSGSASVGVGNLSGLLHNPMALAALGVLGYFMLKGRR